MSPAPDREPLEQPARKLSYAVCTPGTRCIEADWVDDGYVVQFNGNDARGILKRSGSDTTTIDIIGNPDNPNGDDYSVAGISAAMENHSLVRKHTVTAGNTDWDASAGTDADDSEWLVYPQDTFDYLGSHPHMPAPALSITSPEEGVLLTTADITVTFDVSNFTVATAGNGDGQLQYGTD